MYPSALHKQLQYCSIEIINYKSKFEQVFSIFYNAGDIKMNKIIEFTFVIVINDIELECDQYKNRSE